jgi:hypothetical protein
MTVTATGLGCFESLLGAALLGGAPALLGGIDGRPAAGAERVAGRLLGGRYLLQGAMLVVRPQLSGLAVAADGLHAASMVVLAAGSPRHRRAALVSGAAAAVLAVLASRSR